MPSKREEEIETIYDAVLKAIPLNVCMISIIAALTELTNDFALEIGCKHSEEEDEEDEQSYGNLPGTPFSKN
jgi:hypothetical protein